MKRVKLISMLFLLSAIFVACGKQPQEKEWSKLYGYSVDDIAGTYAFSQITDAFDGLTESQYCHICEDAKITITASSGNVVEVNVYCPSVGFSHSFEGRLRVTDDDYIINIGGTTSNTHPEYGLTAYVYENGQGNVRIHGYAQHIEWAVITDSYGEQEYKIKSKTNYYFDVIKN